MSLLGGGGSVVTGPALAEQLKRVEREDKAVRHWLGQVSEAAAAFERRWTMAALRRVNRDLASRLIEQRNLFDEATVTGSKAEIDLHGAATCRGYTAAISAMEAAAEPDDAYLLGQDIRSGFRVAIGHQTVAADRVSEHLGQSVVFITPDEVAAVMAGLEGFKTLAIIKQRFPGCEVLDIRPGDPAKAESGVAA